jgi:gliding motility-associated-like protein
LNTSFFYILVFLGFYLGAKAQTGLIFNGSFEQLDACPEEQSVLFDDEFTVQGWWAATSGSIDNYHECAPDNLGYPNQSVPLNWNGYQPAKEGKGYAGFANTSERHSVTKEIFYEYREYFETRLTEPLEPGGVYTLEFYVSLPDSNLGTALGHRRCAPAADRLGALFTQASVMNSDPLFYGILPHEPGAESAPGLLLSDSLGWQEILLPFVAQGGEEYMTVGFFRNMNQMTHSYYTYDPNDPFREIVVFHYYLDGFSLKKGADLSMPHIFTPNGDAVNDEVSVKLPQGIETTWSIYSRWGNLVYQKTGPEQTWTGQNSFTFLPCTDGTYYYVIELKTQSGVFYKKGSIQLVR